MSEFIKAFIAIAVAGSLLGYLVPKNKMEKPINFLISVVIVIGLFTTFFFIFKGEKIEFEAGNKVINENYMIKSAEYAIEEEVRKVVESLEGDINDVEALINDKYELEKIIVYPKIKDEALLNRLKISLGVEDIFWAEE